MHRWLLLVVLLCLPVQAFAAGFTFVQSGENSNAATGTTIAVTLTSVGAGNLVAVWVGHGSTATTITVSDGASLTATTKISGAGDDVHGQWFYVLSSGSGNKTYTATYGATRFSRNIIAMEYSYTGTASFDQENQNSSDGGSTSITTGNITTTGADSIALTGHQSEFGSTLSSFQIDATTADRNIVTSDRAEAWDLAVTSTFTGEGTATGTNATWVASIVNFVDTASGPPLGGLATLGVGR